VAMAVADPCRSVLLAARSRLGGTDLVLQTNGVDLRFSAAYSASTSARAAPTTSCRRCNREHDAGLTVRNGSGTAVTKVSNVVVTCVTQSFTLSARSATCWAPASFCRTTATPFTQRQRLQPLSGKRYGV